MNLLKKPLLIALVCAALAFAAFLPVLKAEFVWDDRVVQSSHLPYLNGYGAAFKNHPELYGWVSSYYRPLAIMTYIAERNAAERTHGKPVDPRGNLEPARARLPHFNTLLFHLLACGAVVFLAHLVFRDKSWCVPATWICGLTFALNPIHTETVAFVAGRTDSLAMFFMASSLFFALEWVEKSRVWQLALAGAALFLGLLSKEVAMTALLLLPLLFVFAGKGKLDLKVLRQLAAPMGMYIAVAGVYLALRQYGGVSHQGGVAVGLGQMLPNMFSAGALYVAKTVFPWMTEPYIHKLPGMGQSVAAMLAAGAYLVWAARKYLKDGEGIYLLGGLWFVVTLAPSFAIYVKPLTKSLAADRYLYVPSFGFSLALGALLGGLWERWKQIVAAICALLLAAFFVGCWQSSGVWQSDLTLWSHVVQKPQNARSAFVLEKFGYAYTQLNNPVEAEKAYLRVLDPSTEYDRECAALALMGLGTIKFNRADDMLKANNPAQAQKYLREAEQYFAKASSLNALGWIVYRNLGHARLNLSYVSKLLTGKHDFALLSASRSALLQARALCDVTNPDIEDLLKWGQEFMANP